MNRFAIPMLALLATTACLRNTEFQCQDSTQCGAGNTCESTGYCSFPDTQCQRYTDSAGALAGQCVGGTPVDGGLDAPMGDGGVDGPNAGCPAGYNELPGITTGHKYRVLTTIDGWAAQRGACTATSASAYLAIPNDAAELMAISTAAAADYWLGIQDPTEGTYIDVKGQPVFEAPGGTSWATGQPDNEGGADCIASDATAKMRDERCNTKYRAVCECEP